HGVASQAARSCHGELSSANGFRSVGPKSLGYFSLRCQRPDTHPGPGQEVRARSGLAHSGPSGAFGPLVKWVSSSAGKDLERGRGNLAEMGKGRALAGEQPEAPLR